MPRPSSHGGEVLTAARATGVGPEDLLDFSSNADSLVSDLTDTIVRSIPYPYGYYPDDGCRELVGVLAGMEAVEEGEILVGNGSSELIFLCFQALKPRKVVIVGPVFSEYGRACENLGIDHELYLLDEDNGFALTPDDLTTLARMDADMLILCIPNNPTSAVYQDVDAIFSSGRHKYIVVDNTYREFLFGSPAYEEHAFTRYCSLAPRGTSVISLQSFTKAYYCTGIRLGYLLASEQIIDILRASKAPWTVSRFAELAGLAFLANRDAYRERRRNLPALRETFVTRLESTGLFQNIVSSELNFLLAKLRPGQDVVHLQEYLLERRMLVRSCDNIPGMPPGYVRMQVRCGKENLALVEACASYARL
ncbi:MAG: aminotransferase class I/II-fold pyridoxal phosphate-dependent enzyme [Desulfoplanes sp.]|jgi:threonine-phosphate decarboxylase